MKVALVQMPVWWPLDPPLGLAQAAGCLRSAGHDVRVFDVNIHLWKDRPPQYANMWLWEQFHYWNDPEVVDQFFEDNREALEAFVSSILRSDAAVVGFSVNLGSQLPSLRMARLIKSADPRRLVLFGGQYFFLGDQARNVLAHPQVDAVVRGSGDDLLPRLIADYQREGRLQKQPGLVFRQAGEIIDGGAPALPRNLDAVPFADFTLFPMELYLSPNRIPLAASRGCVWACRFCSTREFWGGYGFMSGDRVFAEIRHQRRLFPKRRHIEFYDITANGRPETLARLSDLLIDARLGHKSLSPIARWKINAVLRPEMTTGLLRRMHGAGCVEIIYGVESGSPRVLKLMNKNYSLPVAERVLRDTHEAGIQTVANFMVGFPGETEEDFSRTLGFLRRNRRSLDRAYPSATFTSLEEHSYLTRHADRFGIAPGPDGRTHNLYWETRDGKNTYLVRLDRYRRFRRTAARLGIAVADGINGDLRTETQRSLAGYYRYKGRVSPAAGAYARYLCKDPSSRAVQREARALRKDPAGKKRTGPFAGVKEGVSA